MLLILGLKEPLFYLLTRCMYACQNFFHLPLGVRFRTSRVICVHMAVYTYKHHNFLCNFGPVMTLCVPSESCAQYAWNWNPTLRTSCGYDINHYPKPRNESQHLIYWLLQVGVIIMPAISVQKWVTILLVVTPTCDSHNFNCALYSQVKVRTSPLGSVHVWGWQFCQLVVHMQITTSVSYEIELCYDTPCFPLGHYIVCIIVAVLCDLCASGKPRTTPIALSLTGRADIFSIR